MRKSANTGRQIRPRVAGRQRSPAIQSSGQSEPKRALWSQLTTGGKLVIGLVVTGVVSGLISLFFTVYGPGISDAINPGPPVGVVVQLPDPSQAGGIYVLPGTISPQPATVTGNQLTNLVQTYRGAQEGRLDLKMVLAGRRSQPVVITNISAHIVEKTQPLAGTLLDAQAEGAEGGFNGCIYLDDPTAAVRVADSSGSCDPSARSYFADHYFTLNHGEQMVLDLNVKLGDASKPLPTGAAGHYKFDILLDAVVDGKPTKITVDNSGAPFQLTSYAPKYTAIYRALSDDYILNSVDPAKVCHPSCSDGPTS